MKKTVRFCMCLLVLVFSITILACEKTGPAEKAGKNIDNAMDSMKKEAKKLTE